MKKIGLFIGMLLTGCGTWAQNHDPSVALLLRLDSVSNSTSIARHFARIYYETTIGTVNFFSTSNTRTRELIERLEIRFANYFFESAEAYTNDRPVHPVWNAYYADSTASPLRYVLFGINAHINGDIWRALTAEFSPAEIEELKPGYFAYQKQLLKNYRQFYHDALRSNRQMRTVHVVSFGMDKFYGKVLLSRWRKRQMKLAQLYFTDAGSFEKKRAVLQRKMERLNRLIRRTI